MMRFSLIFCAAIAAMVAATVYRYSRPPEPIRLPSWVHTKESTIWGYAA